MLVADTDDCLRLVQSATIVGHRTPILRLLLPRMGVVDYLVAAVSFRTLPTTSVAVLVYLAIFISVLVTDELPATPKAQRGLNLTQAYSDLRQVRHPRRMASRN